MAAKLTCEVCGGKLVGKPGGVFECESCGVEYSTEWAKEKVQEIKGTVKIEGPVEVQGTVKVEGNASTAGLVKRGMLALEDKQWEKATSLFDQALVLEPECRKAYLGLAMADYHCHDMDAFSAAYFKLKGDRNIQRAKQSMDDELESVFMRAQKNDEEHIAFLAERRKCIARMQGVLPYDVDDMYINNSSVVAYVFIEGVESEFGSGIHGRHPAGWHGRIHRQFSPGLLLVRYAHMPGGFPFNQSETIRLHQRTVRWGYLRYRRTPA